MRWGLGPVFLYECLANSRRWQTYAIRSVGVAVLLAAIATIAMSQHGDRPGARVAGICRTGRVVLLRDHRRGADPGDAGRPGGDRRGHLRGPRPRDPDPHAGHRPLGPRDRPGQAGRAAPADPGPGGLHLAGPGDLLAPGRHRSHGLDARVRDHPGRRPARLHDGAGAVGVGQEAARGRAGGLYLLDARAAPLADLVRPVVRRGSSARRPAGASWRTRTTWRSPRTPCPAGSISGTISASSPRRWGLPVVLAVLAVWRMRPVARRGTDDDRKAAAARPGRPADAMAARPVARRQSRALARVASVAAVAMDDDPGRAGGRVDRHRLRRRRRLGSGRTGWTTRPAEPWG